MRTGMTWVDAKSEALKRFGDVRGCMMTFAYWDRDDEGKARAVVGCYVRADLDNPAHTTAQHAKVVMGYGRTFEEAFTAAPTGQAIEGRVIGNLRERKRRMQNVALYSGNTEETLSKARRL